LGRRRWGEELIGGFSSPHTLLPKEEKEEMNAFCAFCVLMLQKGCRKKAKVFLFIEGF